MFYLTYFIKPLFKLYLSWRAGKDGLCEFWCVAHVIKDKRLLLRSQVMGMDDKRAGFLWGLRHRRRRNPDSKVDGANMGSSWVLSAPCGPHIGPINLAIKEDNGSYSFVQRKQMKRGSKWLGKQISDYHQGNAVTELVVDQIGVCGVVWVGA